MCFPDMLVNDVSWLYMPAKKKQNPLYTIQNLGGDFSWGKIDGKPEYIWVVKIFHEIFLSIIASDFLLDLIWGKNIPLYTTLQ